MKIEDNDAIDVNDEVQLKNLDEDKTQSLPPTEETKVDNVIEHEQENDGDDAEDKESDTDTVKEHEQDEQPEKKPEDTGDELPERNKKNKMPEWAKNRYEKEQRKAQQALDEAAALRAQLAQLQGGNHVQNNNQQIAQNNVYAEPTPIRNQFKDDDSYIEARTNHHLRQQQAMHQAQFAYHQEQRAQQEFTKRLQATENKGAEAFEDFEAVTKEIMYGDKIPHNRAMTLAVLDSEYGHDMLYFLGKYPEKALEIAQLNPVQAVKRIAELEARFKERDKKSVSKAPPPATPVRTNSAKVGSDDLAKLAEDFSPAGIIAFDRAMEKYKQKKNVNPW